MHVSIAVHAIRKLNTIAQLKEYEMLSHVQVRQKLYKTSIGKWKQYADHMQVAAEMLQPLIKRYEQDNAAYMIATAPLQNDEL